MQVNLRLFISSAHSDYLHEVEESPFQGGRHHPLSVVVLARFVRQSQELLPRFLLSGVSGLTPPCLSTSH